MGRALRRLKPCNFTNRLDLSVTPLAWFDAGRGVCTGGARRNYGSDKICFVVAHAAAVDLAAGDGLLSIWIYPVSVGNRVLWSKYQDSSNYQRLELNADSKLHYIAVKGGVTKIEITGTTAITTGLWRHVLVTIDRSAAGGCKIYLDGTDDTAGTPTTSTDDVANTGDVYVWQAGDDTLYWDGSIACLLWAKPADVSAIAAAALSSLYGLKQAKVYGDLTPAEISAWGASAHYNCNEPGATDALIDQHGGNDGVLTARNILSNPDWEIRNGHTWSSLARSDDSAWRAGTVVDPGTDDFSIALFFNAATVATNFFTFISTGAADSARPGFWLHISDADICLRMCDTVEAGEYTHTFDCDLSTGTTYFLVLNCDRDGNAEVFINNVSKGTDSIAAYADSLGYTGDTEIGCLNAGMQHRFDGKLAKIMYFEGHLLTSDERTWLFNSGVGRVSGEIDALGSGDLYDHLVHCWDGTDPSGTILTDQWGSNNCTKCTYSGLIANGTWDANCDNWTAPITAILTSEAGGHSNNCLQVKSGSAVEDYCYQAVPTVAGHEYTINFYHKDGTHHGFYCVGTSIGGTEMQGVTELNDADWALKTLTFTATTATTYINIGVYASEIDATTLFDTMTMVVTKNYCVSDADLFGSWSDVGNTGSTYRTETTAPDAGAISLAHDCTAGFSVVNAPYHTALSVMTPGRPYAGSFRAKASSGTPTFYFGDSSGSGQMAQAIDTSWDNYTGAFTAGSAHLQIGPWTNSESKTILADTFSLTATGGAPAANGPASAILSDSVGDNHGVLTGFGDAQLMTAWSSDVPDVPCCAGGHSLTFDGVANYVLAANGLAGISGDNGWTIAYWVRFLSLTGDPVSLSSSNALYIQHDAAKLHWGCGVGEHRTHAVALGSDWHHLAFVKSASGDNGVCYVDGVAQAVESGTIGDQGAVAAAVLGAYVTPAYYAAVKMDDARVYSDPLTAAQVAALATGDDSDPDWPGDPDVAWWKCDDGIQTLDPVSGDWVIGWESRGADRRQVFQTTGANRPIYYADVLNGKPGVYFDGSNDGLVGSSLFSGDAGLIAAVIKADAQVAADRTVFAQADEASATRYLLLEIPANTMVAGITQRNNDTADEVRGDQVITTGGNVLTGKSTGSRYDIRVDSIESIESAITGSNNGDWFDDVEDEDSFTIGMLKTSSEGNSFKGYICELIVLPEGASAKDIETLERYLFKKYAL